MANAKLTVADGFAPELIKGAQLEKFFDIPCLDPVRELIIPQDLIPFSRRKQSQNHHEFVAFYEHDVKFAAFVLRPDFYCEELCQFPGVITPDCSLYRDASLGLQVINTYRNRMLGYHCQQRGAYVIANVRWGDERSYTDCLYPVKFAFLGIPKHSIVSVGTYGCIKSREDKYYFKQGLKAMLKELQPLTVLVYGHMPQEVFGKFEHLTQFVRFQDWISLHKGKKAV